MNTVRKAPFLAAALLAAILLAACGTAAALVGTPGESASSSSSGAPTQTPAESAIPSPTAETASPSPSPSPSPTLPPCDFLTADFSKPANIAVMERLFVNWGFSYYKPDGKWAADDAYELKLFQRWDKLSPTGAFDAATRKALLAAFSRYDRAKIPRVKLPLEGRYIGINAGHQQKADSRKEPLSPEKNSPKKAMVSSGTQGIATRVPEYKVNLSVALKLRDSLEAQGARTLMVRTTNDVDISNVARCKMMNSAKVDVYISLHCDGNNNRKSHGLHTLIPADRGYQHGGVLIKSQKFSKIMQEELIKATGAYDKGFSTRRDLSSFNWAKMPTCLVEMGFMTYPAEDRLLANASYQDKLVKGFTAGFLRYFREVK